MGITGFQEQHKETKPQIKAWFSLFIHVNTSVGVPLVQTLQS